MKKFDTGPSEGELATRLSDATAALAELGLKRYLDQRSKNERSTGGEILFRDDRQSAIYHRIARQIDTLTNVLGKPANGDKWLTVHGTDRGDELGEMARAVPVFKENMIKADRLQVEESRKSDG